VQADNPGSIGHPNLCPRACLYFAAGNCANGKDCGFCHMPHPKRPVRLDKRHREALRRIPFSELIEMMLPLLKSKARSLSAGCLAPSSGTADQLECTSLPAEVTPSSCSSTLHEAAEGDDQACHAFRVSQWAPTSLPIPTGLLPERAQLAISGNAVESPSLLPFRETQENGQSLGVFDPAPVRVPETMLGPLTLPSRLVGVEAADASESMSVALAPGMSRPQSAWWDTMAHTTQVEVVANVADDSPQACSAQLEVNEMLDLLVSTAIVREMGNRHHRPPPGLPPVPSVNTTESSPWKKDGLLGALEVMSLRSLLAMLRRMSPPGAEEERYLMDRLLHRLQQSSATKHASVSA